MTSNQEKQRGQRNRKVYEFLASEDFNLGSEPDYKGRSTVKEAAGQAAIAGFNAFMSGYMAGQTNGADSAAEVEATR